MDVKRRWKSLSFKVEHLRLELEDRDEALNQYEKDFLEELAKVADEDLPRPEAPETSKDIVVKDFSIPDPDPQDVPAAPEFEGERPEEMKRLWKSIAAATHPDKTGGDPEKTELYKRASEAWKTGSFDELFSVALELGLTPPDPSQDGIQALEKLSGDLQKKLQDSERSVLWMWGTSPPEKRQGIIDIYLKSKGKKRKMPVQS